MRLDVLTPALSHRAEESSQKCEHEGYPLPGGEGQGEGENVALVVMPFTLCALLFCRDRTRERAGWLTATPWRPGLPARKIAAGAVHSPYVV
ncbi:hypothetical protein DXF93_23730 [Escherichia coli]|nr:hypothetical protein DXF93_23730 [Escherichia coli]